MCVGELCHKLLSKTSIHKRRLSSLSDIVATVTKAKTLSVIGLGRKLENNNQTRKQYS